jgi:hypothetical protein
MIRLAACRVGPIIGFADLAASVTAALCLSIQAGH